MLSTVLPIINDVKIQHWDLGDSLGLGFERIIFDLFSEELRPYYEKGVKIHSTSASRDDGKDIIISSPVDLMGVLDFSFYKKGRDTFKIYIECKSSNAGKISFDKAIGNVDKIKKDDVQYFVLVTNTTITPHTYYKIHQSLKENGIEFILIDQYRLAGIFQQRNIQVGKGVDIVELPDFSGEYQTLTGMDNGRAIYDIFLLFKNYACKPHLSSVNLLTDRNWSIDRDSLSFVLEPHANYVQKITVTRAYSDGINDLVFKVKMGKNESQIHIQGQTIESMFEPALIGSGHRACIENFKELILNADAFRIHYLWGEAGLGKSRIIKEIYKDLDGRNYDFGFFIAGQNKFDVSQKIEQFLIDKRYLTPAKNKRTLKDTLAQCDNEYRRAVILIDDCHNADEKLLEQMKELSSSIQKAPVTMIVCGRNDYSVGNLAFYSFVQWSIENQTMEGWILQALLPEETEALVRSIINQVPDIVLDKVCRMSNQNPLFIVQFIEYLLETDLVTIVNRNTVGISNIDTFCEKVYIPQEVQKIYSQRFSHLQKQPEKEMLENFLFVLCVLGGKISTEHAVHLFNEDMHLLETLLKRRFISISEDGLMRFIHESMYLFFQDYLTHDKKKQQETAGIFFSKALFLLHEIGDYDKGRLALWNKQPALAKEYFANGVKILERVDNLSNYTIDIALYEYLFDLYELYKRNKKMAGMLKNILTARIYIALHHRTPVRAIADCDRALELLAGTAALSQDVEYRYAILEQKAHSLLNAGHLADGELLLKDLQAKWLINAPSFDQATVFDLFDRLSGIYIKYNCKELAESYNLLSFKEGERYHSDQLTIIAHLTRAKLYMYQDRQKAEQSTSFIHQYVTSDRIRCSNSISALILKMMYEPHIDWDKCLVSSFLLMQTAVKNSFSTSIIRAYLLLAVCSFHTDGSASGFTRTKEFISKGIDASIKFGIPTHIWQFYNLLGIVDTYLHYDRDHIRRIFETAFAMLSKQNLLYLGNLDLCYGNILAISNFAYFLQSNDFETEFYKKMSMISYKGCLQNCDYNCVKPSCGFICSNSTEKILEEYKKAQEKQLVFTKQAHKRYLYDQKTGYHIILS